MFISRIEDPKLYEYYPSVKRRKVEPVEKSNLTNNKQKESQKQNKSFSEYFITEISKRKDGAG